MQISFLTFFCLSVWLSRTHSHPHHIISPSSPRELYVPLLLPAHFPSSSHTFTFQSNFLCPILSLQNNGLPVCASSLTPAAAIDHSDWCACALSLDVAELNPLKRQTEQLRICYNPHAPPKTYNVSMYMSRFWGLHIVVQNCITLSKLPLFTQANRVCFLHLNLCVWMIKPRPLCIHCSVCQGDFNASLKLFKHTSTPLAAC